MFTQSQAFILGIVLADLPVSCHLEWINKLNLSHSHGQGSKVTGFVIVVVVIVVDTKIAKSGDLGT